MNDILEQMSKNIRKQIEKEWEESQIKKAQQKVPNNCYVTDGSIIFEWVDEIGNPIINKDITQENKIMNFEKITIKLSNGVEISGTANEVMEVAKAMGHEPVVNGYYYQRSKDRYIRIADMHDNHLKNAIVKKIMSRVAELQRKDNTEFISELPKLLSDNPEINALFAELAKRNVR